MQQSGGCGGVDGGEGEAEEEGGREGGGGGSSYTVQIRFPLTPTHTF